MMQIMDTSIVSSERPRRGEIGFTLVELLITVVIIAILTAIAVPAYVTVVSTAQDSAARQALSSVSSAQNIASAGEGSFLSGEALADGGYLAADPNVFAAAQKNCYVTSAKSETGSWFFSGHNRALESHWAEAARSCTVAPPHAPSCPTGQWSAVFFTGVQLEGDPLTVSCLPSLSFSYAGNLPGTNVPNLFSGRFVSTFTAPADGNYDYSHRADDGVRVWIDGDLVVDRWSNATAVMPVVTRSIPLSQGDHVITVEWYESTSTAYLDFSWGSTL